MGSYARTNCQRPSIANPRIIPKRIGMVFGISGVVSIVGGLATGKKMEELQLTEFPNMPFLYWLAVAGAVVKPKWTDKRVWPSLKVKVYPAAVTGLCIGRSIRTAVAAWQQASFRPVPYLVTGDVQRVMYGCYH